MKYSYINATLVCLLGFSVSVAAQGYEATQAQSANAPIKCGQSGGTFKASTGNASGSTTVVFNQPYVGSSEIDGVFSQAKSDCLQKLNQNVVDNGKAFHPGCDSSNCNEGCSCTPQTKLKNKGGVQETEATFNPPSAAGACTDTPGLDAQGNVNHTVSCSVTCTDSGGETVRFSCSRCPEEPELK